MQFRDTKFSHGDRVELRTPLQHGAVGLLRILIAITLLVSGRVGFEFFATPEVDMMYANFSLTPGTSRNKSSRWSTNCAARPMKSKLN